MFNIGEYKSSPKRLSDRLVWALLLENGVVLNKDGSMQRTVRYRGPDLDSSDPSELVSLTQRLNNLLRRFGSGWAIFTECQRRQVSNYPESDFPLSAALLLDEERRSAYESVQTHFDNAYYLTLVYLPPSDTHKSLGNIFLSDQRTGASKSNWWTVIEQFVEQTNLFYRMLDSLLLELEVLCDSDLLTYLHSTVSDKYHPVAMPDCSNYMDSFLTDSPYVGGMAPCLGDHHLRMISIRYLPNESFPGILNSLYTLAFEFRYCCRFIAMDKQEATKLFESFTRKWMQKRKGAMSIAREVVTKEPAQVENTAALEQASDSEAARLETELDLVSQGYYTATVVLWDKDPAVVEDKVTQVEGLINGLGFTTIYEKLNATEAYLGSLPGHCYANVRRPVINSLNLSHFMPVTSVWCGEAHNAHLDAPALLMADTTGAMPFSVNFHHGELGHVFIIGPTRSGKTFFINLAASQFTRYPDAHVIHFDKDMGGYVTCLAHGGVHYRFSAGGGLSFQPLADIDDEAEAAWAATWLQQLLEMASVTVNATIKQRLWSALQSFASSKRSFRTMTNFVAVVQDKVIREALLPYTKDGPYGTLFDGNKDEVDIRRWVHFEMGELFKLPDALEPALMLLFHRLDRTFNQPDGPPVLLLLDEGWLYLENPRFKAQLRDWLKTKAKANVSVWFST